MSELYALLLLLLSCDPTVDVDEFRQQLRQDLAEGRREFERRFPNGETEGVPK